MFAFLPSPRRSQNHTYRGHLPLEIESRIFPEGNAWGYFGVAEKGSGTAWALMLVMGIFAAGYLVIALALAHQARWQVQTAADFGALAAATAWRTGFDPCHIAQATVAHNGAEMNSCQFGPNGQMKVTANIRINLIGTHQIIAHSIAGPRLVIRSYE